jgi:hypothetical protein
MRKATAWGLGTFLPMHLALFAFVLPAQNNAGKLQLSGTWTAYIPAKSWSRGGILIIQNGQDLTYVHPDGERHNGRVLSEKTISYVQANDTGKVSADGMRIDWSNGYWSKAGQQPQQPSPKPHGVRYQVENFVYGGPELYQNPRNLHDFIVDFASCSVWNANSPEQVKVSVSYCRDRKRLQFTSSAPGQTVVLKYDWVFLDDGKTISGAYNQGGTFGPSVGGVRNP